MVIEAILASGQGTKWDIKSVYKLLPIAINDRYLLGMKWRRLFYVDLFLSFCSRVAPVICTVFVDVWDIIQRDLISSKLLHYLDDYLLMSAPGRRKEAATDFRTDRGICNFLGIPVNKDKDFPHLPACYA